MIYNRNPFQVLSCHGQDEILSIISFTTRFACYCFRLRFVLFLTVSAGLTTLTPSEVLDDMSIIHKTPGSGMDSECSSNADEVLVSVYPVKPRRFLLRSHNRRQAKPDAMGETSAQQINESFQFLKDVQKSHSKIYEKELEREEQQRQLEVRRILIPVGWFMQLIVQSFKLDDLSCCTIPSPLLHNSQLLC